MNLKAARLQAEASKILCGRRQIIYSRYKDFQRTLHPSQWRYLPQTWEIIGYEPFARHVDAPLEVEVTVVTFDDAFAHLPKLLAAAMEGRKNSLRDLCPNGPNEDETIDTSLDLMDLATATFQCKQDPAFLFGWDEIASHHCREEVVLFTHDGVLPLKTTPLLVEYSPWAANVVKKVAEVIGLDHTTVTPADLDEENMRFSCDSCGPHKEGAKYYKPGYDWRTLVRL
jgi:hypothetical protein